MKPADVMKAEMKARHDKHINKEVSPDDIEEALKETIEQRVTPLSHLSYPD